MNDLKEQLKILIQNAPTVDTVYGGCKLPRPARTLQTIIDALVAGGVVIPVRCGKCEHWKEDEGSGGEFGECYCFGYKRRVFKRADGYCDRGVKRE